MVADSVVLPPETASLTASLTSPAMLPIPFSVVGASVVGACVVSDNEDLLMIESGGVILRTSVENISIQGRDTQSQAEIDPNHGRQKVGC